MKSSKFSDAQKVFIIRQVEDGTPVVEVWVRDLDGNACTIIGVTHY